MSKASLEENIKELLEMSKKLREANQDLRKKNKKLKSENIKLKKGMDEALENCLLYTSPSPRDPE